MRRLPATPSERLVTVLLLTVMLIMASEMAVVPCMACSSSSSSSKDNCSSCISNRFKNNCPACVPIMRCMARCLWGATSRTKCSKKCDCNSDYPKLADCKNCLSQCKCICSSSA